MYNFSASPGIFLWKKLHAITIQQYANCNGDRTVGFGRMGNWSTRRHARRRPRRQKGPPPTSPGRRAVAGLLARWTPRFSASSPSSTAANDRNRPSTIRKPVKNSDNPAQSENQLRTVTLTEDGMFISSFCYYSGQFIAPCEEMFGEY
jgi:hypothetical protein